MTWAPNLFTYYVDHLHPLYEKYPHLKHNFCNSIFACITFNFGPFACSYDHTDPGNLPFGWYTITVLGSFDPTQGSHLILWDLQLVIEFPLGSTILIPSATLWHSNTAIQPGEKHYSFTQYTAGGLFRWVDHGFQKEDDFWAGLSAQERAEEKKVMEGRWAMGLGLFSTVDELKAKFASPT